MKILSAVRSWRLTNKNKKTFPPASLTAQEIFILMARSYLSIHSALQIISPWPLKRYRGGNKPTDELRPVDQFFFLLWSDPQVYELVIRRVYLCAAMNRRLDFFSCALFFFLIARHLTACNSMFLSSQRP